MSASWIWLLSLVLGLAARGTGSVDLEEPESTPVTPADDVDAVATTVEGVTLPPRGTDVCDGANCTLGEEDGAAVPIRPTRNVEPYPVNYDDTEYSSDSTPGYDLRLNPLLYACMSTPQLEPFPPLQNPNQEYLIPGVRIGRCNGCNCGRLRSCQPAATEPVIFLVEVKNYKTNNKRGSTVTTLENITMYNHTACRCQCKKECAPPRVLNRDTCTCVCGPRLTCPGNLVWSTVRCACQCVVKAVPCAKPRIVDPETCECRDRTEQDGNRALQKKKPTEVARDGEVAY